MRNGFAAQSAPYWFIYFSFCYGIHTLGIPCAKCSISVHIIKTVDIWFDIVWKGDWSLFVQHPVSCRMTVHKKTVWIELENDYNDSIHAIRGLNGNKSETTFSCIYQTNTRLHVIWSASEKRKLKIKRENKQHENAFSAHKTWFAINSISNL